MSDYLPCITNQSSMIDIRSCTVRDQHTDFCDGFEHRYREVWDPDDGLQGRYVWTEVHPRVEGHPTCAACLPPGVESLPPCGGCLPHRAEHGLLCWHCWEKTRDALNVAPDMITHLRSVEKAQQLDNGGVRTAAGWVIPVPQTWRLADELLMLLGAPAPGFPSTANVDEVADITEQWAHPDADLWVSTEAGAEDAVRFYRLMQTAMAQHPMAEYEHRIKNVRCAACKEKTLLWKPPLAFEEDVRVVCENPACGAEISHDRFQALAQIEEYAARARRGHNDEEETA